MKTNLKTMVVEAVLAGMILVAAGTAGAAPQGTIDIAHDGFAAAGSLAVWGGGVDGLTTMAGVHLLNASNGTEFGEIFGESTLPAMCVELTQFASSETRTYRIVPPEWTPQPLDFLGGSMTYDKAEYIRELWGRFYDPAWAEGGSYTEDQRCDAKAFAAAIWEIVYEELPDTPLLWDVEEDGSAGPLGFHASNLDIGTANTWLHSLDGTGPKADLRGLTNCNFQDFIVEVPEPATIMLLGLGGMGLLRSRRRKLN